ncbi:MAG: hypothetical protein WCL23_01720 [Candidatus Moraniibacteriota bacterium]
MLKKIIVPGAGKASIFREALIARGFDPIVPEGWNNGFLKEIYPEEILHLPHHPCEAAQELSRLKAKSIEDIRRFEGFDVVGFHSIALAHTQDGKEIPMCMNEAELARVYRALAAGGAFTYHVEMTYGKLVNGIFIERGTGQRAIGLHVESLTEKAIRTLTYGIGALGARAASPGNRPLTNPICSQIITDVEEERGRFFGLVGLAIEEFLSAPKASSRKSLLANSGS